MTASKTTRRDSAIDGCLQTCENLYRSGIFHTNNCLDPLFEAAVVQLLINLNDLVRKADADGNRVTITEGITQTADVADVTDVITKCRNAACHIGSSLQDVNSNQLRFCTAGGYSPGAMSIDGVVLGCDYSDDIAVFYGTYRFYLKRHGRAALRRLIEIYRGSPA